MYFLLYTFCNKKDWKNPRGMFCFNFKYPIAKKKTQIYHTLNKLWLSKINETGGWIILRGLKKICLDNIFHFPGTVKQFMSFLVWFTVLLVWSPIFWFQPVWITSKMSTFKCVTLFQAQDNLMHELRSHRFFDVFEYNGPMKIWGCFLCNHPDRATYFVQVCLIIFIS